MVCLGLKVRITFISRKVFPQKGPFPGGSGSMKHRPTVGMNTDVGDAS